MANKFIRYLTGDGNFFNNVVGGIVRPKGIMGDYQHAARIFGDNLFRLAPRQKFLFYALFEIDPTAHNATAFTQKHSQEVGLLVKTADLPKYNFDTVVKHQYNRKKLLYRTLNYEPINLTLHDDNAGIINSLMAIYYGTYVVDRALPTSAYSATHLRAGGVGPLDSFRYGLDNNKSVDIFKSISLYTLSRRRFNGYTFINPRITNMNQGSVDVSASAETIECSMTIQYEAVKYSSGNVGYNSPKGFASLHYDFQPSPLSVSGGGTATLLGEGGVLDGLESIFGDVAGGTTFDSVGGFLGTAIKAVNTYRNYKDWSKGGVDDALKREGRNVLNNPDRLRGVINGVSGIVNSTFPKNVPSTDTTVANQRKIIT